MLHLSDCDIFLLLRMYIPPRFHLQTYFNIQNNANGLWGLLDYFGGMYRLVKNTQMSSGV